MIPTFLVLGGVRCGTSSLHHYLGQHPDIYMTPVKEPPFFDAEYDRGIDWYRRTYFSSWRGESAAGESRPSKLFLPFVPGRIRESLPEIRLIALLREPVARAFSHWWLATSNRREALSFEQAIELNLKNTDIQNNFEGIESPLRWREYLDRGPHEGKLRLYLEQGYYDEHLARYFSHFPREQILVIQSEKLYADPVGTVRQITRFLGVDPDPSPADLFPVGASVTRWGAPVRYLVTRYQLGKRVPFFLKRWVRKTVYRFGPQPTFPAHMGPLLREHYLPHVKRLETLTGLDLSEWKPLPGDV